jgi:O-antigen/teichoic acid export membrane protein
MNAEPGTQAQPLGRQVAGAAALMVGARLAMRLVSLVSTLILVRVFMPEDFGIVALASTAFVILDTLTQTNFAMAVIRRPDATTELYDTAWTLNIARCVLLGAIVAATAGWQAELLGDARVAPLLLVVALTVVLDGFASVGLFRRQRDLQFSALFQYQLGQKIVGFVVTIGLAVTWGSYWALVIGPLAAKALAIPHSYILAPHRPRLRLRGAGMLIDFSKWMFALNVLAIFNLHLPNLLLGRLYGPHALGMFQVAYQIAAAPVTEIAAPARAPIYAGYSRVHHDLRLLGEHYLAGFGLLCALITPLSVGIALTAPEIEVLALGANFAGAAPLIALCALFALAECIAHFTGNIFFVLDRQREMVRTYAMILLLRIPVVLAGLWLGGALGMAIGLAATAALNALAWNRTAVRLMGLRLRDLGREAWRSFAAAAAMSAVVVLLRLGLEGEGWGPVMRLLLLAAAGAGTLVAAQYLLWRLQGSPAGAERQLLRTAGGAIGRLRSRLGRATG